MWENILGVGQLFSGDKLCFRKKAHPASHVQSTFLDYAAANQNVKKI